jgi:hypothetical protein
VAIINNHDACAYLSSTTTAFLNITPRALPLTEGPKTSTKLPAEFSNILVD